MTYLPLIVCAAILLINLPSGQGAPLETIETMEFQGPLATGTEVRAKRFSPLLFGIAWILGTNFAAGVARAASSANRNLHETRLQLENVPANTSQSETSPEILPMPDALLVRPTRSTAEDTTPEVPRGSAPFSPIVWNILSWLTPAGFFLKPVLQAAAEAQLVKESTRVERDAPNEDAETSPGTDSLEIPETANFVDFYERLRDIRHQMGLDSNQTLTLEAVLDNNSTRTLEFVINVTPTGSRTSPIVNFLYLWLIIMIVCVGILGSIAIYENAPRYIKKIQGSLMRHKGPSTKGKDMKQDLTDAV